MDRYAVFVDGGYARKVWEQFGSPRVSYLKFSDHVAGNQERLRTYYYDCAPYVKNSSLYKCPTGIRGELVTYSIVHSMLGPGSQHAAGQLPEPIRNIDMIKRPGERFVFLDEGKWPHSPWGVWYERPMWWDLPTIRHSKGTNWSYADGHSAYHKWTDKRTMELAWGAEGFGKYGNTSHGWASVETPGNRDLEWIQKGVWGKLGYTPKP